MDPSSLLVPLVLVPLVKKLLSLVWGALKAPSITAARRKELDRFRTRLLDHLQYWESLSDDLACAGFPVKALERFNHAMQEFVPIANELLKGRHLKKEDIRKFQEDVMTASLWGISSALMEVLCKIWMELEAQGIEKKFAMQIQLPALGIPKVLSSSVVPSPTAERARSSDLALLRHRSDKLEQAATDEQSQKKVMQAYMRKAASEFEDNKNNNPNLSMSFSSPHSDVSSMKGQLCCSKRRHDNRIEVWMSTSAGPRALEGAKDVRAMIGTRPMKVSEELGYFYYEVQVLRSKTCALSGVGVGLATREKFRDNKMVGWYSESFGYDGSIGTVFCNKSPQEPFQIGKLEEGDTLGIGLYQPQPNQRPAIFFVKNGVLQGYTQAHNLKRSFTHLLHPVISIMTSQYAKVCVNFHGPFHLPSGLDLAAMLEIN